MNDAFDLSLPDARMTAALVLSRRLRSRFTVEVDVSLDWEDVRRRGVLPPDLVLAAIAFFNRGSRGDLRTRYERGRVLVAAQENFARVRSMLLLIPGRDDVSEIRLDGDWVVCRLRHEIPEGRQRDRAQVSFLRRNRKRFPPELTLNGVDYRCSYGFANWADFIGIDPLEIAITDVQSWFDSLGQVLMPLHHPTEAELQEVLVISPLGFRQHEEPWCWSALADRLIPFLLADFSPMRTSHPRLVAQVARLVDRLRAAAWTLPVGVRAFRRVQRKLHWSHEGDFDDVPTLLAMILECEARMEQFAAEFEPLLCAHADAVLEVMDAYCADARKRLWLRLQAEG